MDRKTIGVVTALLAACVMATPAMAKEKEVIVEQYSNQQIVPYWLNVLRINAKLSKSGNTVNVETYIKASNSNYGIEGTVYLEEKIGGSWSVVDSWSISGTGILSETEYYYGDSGSTYRSRVEVSVEGEDIEKVSATLTV